LPVLPAATVAALVALIVATVAHSAETGRAAPINFSQRAVGDNESLLTAIFDRFARWQTVRVILQVIALLAAVVALATHPR
jgi:hypothetical protein